MKRASGILLHIASLPSPYGIGGFGKEAYDFADFLKKAGQKYWQMLPLGHTGFGNSPYQVFSMYAGNPYFIDLDLLAADGLLEDVDILGLDWGTDPRRIDYGSLWAHRYTVLRRAFERGGGMKRGISAFRGNNPWVDEYALFMSLKAYFGGGSWLMWPDESVRMRKPAALEKYRRLLKDEMAFFIFLQYLFFRQWKKLKTYVSSLGISLIGDLPIYVSADSVEVWSRPEFFMLDNHHRPAFVAGVPPDYFSRDGQLWGNPLYRWDALKSDGYKLWMDRFRAAAAQFDMIRIDHFRGLESYWKVPAGKKNARRGKWESGPGMDFVNALKSAFPKVAVIAEDLGERTPGLDAFVAESGLPCIKVMQFSFPAKGGGSELPHEYPKNCVCFTGTHDNDTAMGWIASLSGDNIRLAGAYLGFRRKKDAPWALIRGGMTSPADLFVAQMQDYLELPGSCRMNTPGTGQGNWQWRMKPEECTGALAEKIAYLTEVCKRL